MFLSPQVKRSVIISNKHDLYELPHELPNDLTFRTSGPNSTSEPHRVIAHCPAFLPKSKFCQY